MSSFGRSSSLNLLPLPLVIDRAELRPLESVALAGGYSAPGLEELIDRYLIRAL
jgi:hypothetical protein